jgi:hypothetical protein
MPTFDRGFKSFAERTAIGLRRELNLLPHDPLDPVKLASSLDIRLLTPAEIQDLPADILHQLLENDPFGWSAVTLLLGKDAVVIYNPRKSKGRKAVDIMHELAHVLLNHQPAMIILSADGATAMRTFDARQEDEANWLSWCLLLPRDGLVYAKRSRMTVPQIAEHFAVTEVLVNFRVRISGVEAQFRRTRSA